MQIRQRSAYNPARMRLLPIPLLLRVALLAPGDVPSPAYQVYGLDFSPYVDGQNPNDGSVVTLAQVERRLDIVAPYTQ
jgi:hypothetical protein